MREETSSADVWFFCVVCVLALIAAYAPACCTPTPPKHPGCTESVQPIGFGFGAKCAEGAIMTYRAPPRENELLSPSDPWQGGYIVCACP